MNLFDRFDAWLLKKYGTRQKIHKGLGATLHVEDIKGGTYKRYFEPAHAWSFSDEEHIENGHYFASIAADDQKPLRIEGFRLERCNILKYKIIEDETEKDIPGYVYQNVTLSDALFNIWMWSGIGTWAVASAICAYYTGFKPEYWALLAFVIGLGWLFGGMFFFMIMSLPFTGSKK